MMKSIEELIHDRVFADGGTLVVWLDTAKFRVVETKPGQERLRPRTIWVSAELGDSSSDGVITVPGSIGYVDSKKFTPSSELVSIMRRNADSLREYLERLIRENRSNCGID